MPYPTGEDLAAFLVAQGVIEAAPSDLSAYDDAMEAAASDWERDTGWQPFLAGPSETLIFDGPEGYKLFLPTGVISHTALTIDGTSYTSGTHYWLQDRIGSSGPYTSVELGFYATGARRSISITGVFGYQTTLDKAVERALFAKAGSDLVGFTAGQAGELRREKVGAVEYEYDTTAGRGSVNRLRAMYDEAVKRYKRWA